MITIQGPDEIRMAWPPAKERDARLSWLLSFLSANPIPAIYATTLNAAAAKLRP